MPTRPAGLRRQQSLALLSMMGGLFGVVSSTSASNATWQNIGTDWTTDANWSAAYPKASSEVATFNAISAGSIKNPNLAADVSLGTINFDNSNADYSITQTGSRNLGLSGVTNMFLITGSGTSNIAPEVRSNGTKTISNGSTTLNFNGGFAISGGNTTVTVSNTVPLNIASVTCRDGVNRTLSFNGSGTTNITGSIFSTAGGSIKLESVAANSGTLTLGASNTLVGTTVWRSGTLILGNSGSTGGQTILMGTSTASTPAVSVLFAAGVNNLNNLGFNPSQANASFTIGGNSAGTATQSGALALTDFSNSAAVQLTAAASGVFNVTGNIGGGTTAGKINKIGAGTAVLSGVNSYAGTTTVTAGMLQFTRKLALYNNTTANWSTSFLTVQSGATMAFNVNSAVGAVEFSETEIQTLAAVGSGTAGFRSGSSIGLDTTNASGGNFSYTKVLANPNGGSNVLGLTKLGENTLTLTQANTYSGKTLVSAGTLNITGSITNNTAANVFIATDPTGTFGTSDDVTLTRATGLNASYANLGSTEVGGLSTVANLRMGLNSTNNPSGESVSMKWRMRAANETPGTHTYPPSDPQSRGLISDVISITGMANSVGSGQTDAFVLEMNYVDAGFAGSGPVSEASIAAAGYLRLDWLDPNGAGTNVAQWENAVAGNFGVGSLTNSSTQNFQGSFNAFLAAHPGTTDANIFNYLGSYGVDTSSNTVWAVLNHNSSFAVVPEPGAAGFALISGATLLLNRRRKRV